MRDWICETLDGKGMVHHTFGVQAPSAKDAANLALDNDAQAALVRVCFKDKDGRRKGWRRFW